MRERASGAMSRFPVRRVLAVLLVGWIAVGAATADDAPKSAQPPSTEEWIREMYEHDLRKKQRRLDVDGRIGVTNLECASGKRRRAHVPCLAHVAATGEARRLAPIHVTIDVYFHHPNVFEYDVAPKSRAARAPSQARS